MATWDDVRGIALAQPGAVEGTAYGKLAWKVDGKLFVWERPLRKADLAALGDAAPSGPVLGARVEHLGAKEALVQDPSGVFFTTPHFDGVPSVLVQLDRIDVTLLEEVVVEAWWARAPAKLTRRRSGPPRP